MDWIKRSIYGAVTFLIEDMNGTYSNELWEWFSHLFGTPIAVLTHPTVRTLNGVALTIALTALAAAVAWKALRFIFETMDGTVSNTPQQLARRIFTAALAATSITLYVWYAATLADYLREVVAAFGIDVSLLLLFFETIQNGPLLVLILLLIFLIGAGVVTLQRAIYTVEFMLLIIVGPFLAISLLNEDNPMPWQLWKREVLAICMTPVLQFLVLTICIRTLTGTDPASLGRWVQGFALIYLLWNMPRWARQFTYSTGVGGALAGATGSMTRFAVMRYMYTRWARRG